MTSEVEQHGAIYYPEDKLSFGKTVFSGIQHVVAMFGATVLGPLLMGFDPNVAIFFSGIATILFFYVLGSDSQPPPEVRGIARIIFYLLRGGRIPSYLGSSFSFIAAVGAATAYSGHGLNPNIPVALGGIIAAGILYCAIGAIVSAVGYAWINRLMPPVVTGVIVGIIGLNLAKVAVGELSGSTFNTLFGLLTIVLVAMPALYAPGFFNRLPILIGAFLSYFLYLTLSTTFNIGVPIDFSGVANAHWFAPPQFQLPIFDFTAITLIAPIAIILVAENLGHVKAVSAMTGRPLDAYLGKAFMGDGLATIIAGSFGGTGVTTYAENIGVMAATKNYSSLTFLAAGAFAVLLGCSPKVGAIIHTIPVPILGGLSFVVFGLITSTAGRIWVANNGAGKPVDFADPRNQLVVGVSLVMGAGDLTIKIGDFAVGGIAMATFSAIFLYHLLGMGANSKPNLKHQLKDHLKEQ